MKRERTFVDFLKLYFPKNFLNFSKNFQNFFQNSLTIRQTIRRILLENNKEFSEIRKIV